MSREEIDRVVRGQANPKIRLCYDQQARIHRYLRGRIVVQWIIGPDGRVAEAKVAQDEPGHQALTDCITNVILGLQFPKPRGGGKVLVTYPWVFTPGEDSGFTEWLVSRCS